MKTSELIRLLKQHGCYLVRHGGNHDVWYSPITRQFIVVARHEGKEVSKGTAKAILKNSGIKV